MTKRKDSIIKTQADIQKELIQPKDQPKLPLSGDSRTKRASNRRVDDSNFSTLSVGLQDIDEAIFYYFNNVIRPSVNQNGTKVNVPLIYGSPERWSSVQRDGYYRDRNGKIMTPLIMIKRESIEKNRSLGNKLDANSPQNFQIFEKKYTRKNVYDTFSVLTNRIPTKEFYGVVIPDYVNLVYNCIIFTDYIEQMNKIVESINYASDSYWGDPSRFKFRAMINNYTTAVELSKGQDRAVKTTFSINLLGHIVPDSINTELKGSRKFFSKSRVNFKLETVSNLENLNARAETPERDSTRPFYSTPQITDETLDFTELTFLNTLNTALPDTVGLNLATFNSKTILTPPPGFFIDEESFTVYVNGISIQPNHVSVQQVGSNIEVVFYPNLIGYNITSTDTIVLTGKFT